jgi:hypothetical protein
MYCLVSWVGCVHACVCVCVCVCSVAVITGIKFCSLVVTDTVKTGQFARCYTNLLFPTFVMSITLSEYYYYNIIFCSFSVYSNHLHSVWVKYQSKHLIRLQTRSRESVVPFAPKQERVLLLNLIPLWSLLVSFI